MLHGTFESKAKIIDDFNNEHPECSKASIERYIKEISSRQKSGENGKYRYIVDEEVIEQLGTDQEKAHKLWQDRYDTYIQEIFKIEQEKQKEIEQKEKLKQQEKEKKLQEKKIEKEKKDAEKLKLRQEKERLKSEKKLEQEKIKEQKKIEKEKVKELKKLEKEMMKSEKKRLKEVNSTAKSKSETTANLQNINPNLQNFFQKDSQNQDNVNMIEEDKEDYNLCSPVKDHSKINTSILQSSGEQTIKRGRGRPKGSKSAK